MLEALMLCFFCVCLRSLACMCLQAQVVGECISWLTRDGCLQALQDWLQVPGNDARQLAEADQILYVFIKCVWVWVWVHGMACGRPWRSVGGGTAHVACLIN
jgi:hypothetical protein